MTVLVPESITKFGCLTKISSMQPEECCKTCVGADINCLIPYKEVTFPNVVPFSVVASFTDQDSDLALKSSSNAIKWRWSPGSSLVASYVQR